MPKFPHYKQLDAMDCGHTCLRMVAKYYGKSYSLKYLRSRSYITREGVSMLGISEAAENVGFRTKGYRLTWEELRGYFISKTSAIFINDYIFPEHYNINDNEHYTEEINNLTRESVSVISGKR